MTPTESRPQRLALRAMYVGLALNIAATIAPYVDRATGNVLADHIRTAYPAYPQSRVDSAVTTWLVILGVVGCLGVISWIWTMWAVKAGKSWARGAATAMLAIGVTTALTALLVRDSSGDVGLAPLLGWIEVTPCMAGIVAVTALWRATADGS